MEDSTDWLKNALNVIKDFEKQETMGRVTMLADNGITDSNLFDIQKFREMEGNLIDLQDDLSSLESRVTLLGFANVFLFALAAIFAVTLINK